MKFMYQITNEDYNFITIFPFDKNFLQEAKCKYILEEKELKEYIEKYPHSCSLSTTDETDQEARRLYELYNLEHLLGD